MVVDRYAKIDSCLRFQVRFLNWGGSCTFSNIVKSELTEVLSAVPTGDYYHDIGHILEPEIGRHSKNVTFFARKSKLVSLSLLLQVCQLVICQIQSWIQVRNNMTLIQLPDIINDNPRTFFSRNQNKSLYEINED